MRAVLVALCLSLPACSRVDSGDAPPAPSVSWHSPSAKPLPAVPSASGAASGDPKKAAPLVMLDPSRPLHADSQEALLSMFPVRTFTEKEIKMRGEPKLFLEKNFGPGTQARINQGNPELAHHDVTRDACLKGLEGVVLQTEEDLKLCGAPLMVPLRKGKKRPKACIDVFEFPNQPCELPFVWIAPTQASAVCEMQGKRLCNQDEWMSACRGDPEGGKDSVYAYGDELDLDACNTNKPGRKYGGVVCDADSAKSAWATCGTNTEPAGSFPRCRSRLGVFDLHGNVAEIMTRMDEEGWVSQLKGSAFFYVDVHRKHDERPRKDDKRETYPDHCAHDPRWHVEPMSNAWHVNYHLGFRCCKNVGGR